MTVKCDHCKKLIDRRAYCGQRCRKAFVRARVPQVLDGVQDVPVEVQGEEVHESVSKGFNSDDVVTMKRGRMMKV